MGEIIAIDKKYNPVIYYDTLLDSRSAEENEYMHNYYGDFIIEKNGSFYTLGSAIIAGYSIGLFNNLEDILKRFVKSNIKISPIPGEDKKYIKYIEIYKELFDSLKGIYKKISS